MSEKCPGRASLMCRGSGSSERVLIVTLGGEKDSKSENMGEKE